MAEAFRGSDGDEPFTRRVFARRMGGAVVGARFLSLLDGIAIARQPASQSPPLEQHVVPGARISTDNGVEIVVPPLYHELVTARLTSASARSLLAARDELRVALGEIEEGHVVGPSGLLTTVAWGLPYFRRHLPRLKDGRRFPDYLPVDRQASRRLGRKVPALLDAVRFPSDPVTTVLESNDVVVLLRSDVRSHVTTARERLLERLKGVLQPTSIRSGFVGAGLPKRFATAAGIPGSDSVPDDAQLFLGFTSTQRSALGPTRIANLESLRGMTDQWPDGYFRHGTVMHLSHVFEDLESWYSGDFLFRVWAAFRPGLTPPDGTRTLPEDASVVQTEQDVLDGLTNQGIIGHSASLQPVSRLSSATVDNYGERYAAGTALVQRADFNTLENPFGWTIDPRTDRWRAEPAAGLHFVSFTATASMFERVRRAMDGHYPDGRATGLDPHDEELGLNSVLRTTRRQNFLVPPRAHRSFPLAELA
ncbi:MAG TPA: hypothetical protein VFA30_04420 [Gaiellaceae bacterium]|nr:hypothetical protein [Gaiellaceae bacterium]